jgi:S-DNA-T family DNA segregation ATPase FtsK/SpoIIIE
LAEYRKIGSPGGRIARSLLLIDEYQRLFEDDRGGEASSFLKNIAEQGRSAGLHLLLGSQRFTVVGMLNQNAIFGNMHLRVAMKLPLEEVQSLGEFGRAGRRLIEQCDEPGKVVINENGGAEDANRFGKIVFIDKDMDLPAIIESLARKARERIHASDRFDTIVFDGKEQPNLCENPQMTGILDQPRRPNADGWHEIASTPVHKGGLGISDWFEGERPLALWLGQELDVYGHARVVLRRRNGENVLFVGDEMMALCGMMASCIISACVMEAPSDLVFYLLDRTMPRNPWEHMLGNTHEKFLMRLGLKSEFSRDASILTRTLEELSDEMERRHGLPEVQQASEPTILVVIAAAERVPSLVRQPGAYGTFEDGPEALRLKSLLARGPVVGVHCLFSFPGTVSLLQLFDRSQLGFFRHRIATQLSEADSFTLLERNSAARLQSGKPTFAILHDHGMGRSIKFKPYTVDAEIPWDSQFQRLAERLSTWNPNP